MRATAAAAKKKRKQESSARDRRAQLQREAKLASLVAAYPVPGPARALAPSSATRSRARRGGGAGSHDALLPRSGPPQDERLGLARRSAYAHGQVPEFWRVRAGSPGVPFESSACWFLVRRFVPLCQAAGVWPLPTTVHALQDRLLQAYSH
jgi:hypothetical protein